MSATPTTGSSSSPPTRRTKGSTSPGTSWSPSSSTGVAEERDAAARPPRLLAIVNPRAGGGRCARRAAAALERLRAGGVEVEVAITGAPWEATQIARRGFAAGVRHFAALGGDGTAFEVLNGFLPPALDRGVACSLAPLPLGTGNSFVRHFARLLSPEHARHGGGELVFDALLAGRRRRCDVLRLEHSAGEHLALGTVSLGFAAAVAHRVNRTLKPLGVVGYTVGVLLELLRLPAPRLEAVVHCDGQAHSLRQDAVFVAIQNVAYTGGNMLMAPDADPTDGRAELVILDRVGRVELLRAFPRIFRGDHVSHPAVTVRSFERLDLVGAQRQLVMLDGEVLELQPRSVEVLPGALEVWI
ncbi:MAG TPA: diacylglycerol kinase family protein [Thermoanaerobaculia bacterium]|nr:diacylglycerol kinase family protein [Thermoanaerobaculia bacterium]